MKPLVKEEVSKREGEERGNRPLRGGSQGYVGHVCRKGLVYHSVYEMNSLAIIILERGSGEKVRTYGRCPFVKTY